MSPDAAWEDEFNHWYDEEHIPVRMKVPGFRGAQRYQESGRRNYLAVYELETPSALRSPEYQAVKNNPSEITSRMLSSVTGFTRYIGDEMFEQRRADLSGDPLDAPLLYSVWFNVPADRLEEFDAWYNEDHIPILLENRHWLWARRFSISDAHPDPWNRLALHYLADASALESPERERARATEWRARLAQEPWFKGRYTVFQKRGRRYRGERGAGPVR
jgi:hypothetical protein